MAFGVLGADFSTTAVSTPVSTWVDLLNPMSITATGGLVQFQGFVNGFMDGELLLQILVDTTVVATGNSTEPLFSIANVAAGAHTVHFQGYWTGAMNPATPSANNQGMSVIALA